VSKSSHPLLDDPTFRRFFGDNLPKQRRMESSLGSAVIMSPEGYLLTNNHVTAGADQIVVALKDGRETLARLVGSDPETDLAVLKIDLKDLPAMTLGRSDQVKIGDVTLAIGNPFGVGQTVTMGIISATGRNQLGLNTYEDFIQTDAAINPGNSGGALINARGELVGINTVIFSRSGGYQGIGFAVSSNLARQIFDELRQFREVRRGAISSVRFEQVTPAYARRFRAPDLRGALVYELDRDSAAYRAGIEAGDIVIAFNGIEIQDPGQLERLMSKADIGSTATLRVLRMGKPRDVRVPIQKRS